MEYVLRKFIFIRMYSSSIHYCHVVNRLRSHQLRGKVFGKLGHEVMIWIMAFLSVIGNADVQFKNMCWELWPRDTSENFSD